VSGPVQGSAKSDPAAMRKDQVCIALQVECFHDVMLVLQVRPESRVDFSYRG
jgi:hypothetical protein